MPAGAPRKHPALVKVQVNTKLPAWLLEWLRDQDQSIAVLIEEAVIEKHKLTPPKVK